MDYSFAEYPLCSYQETIEQLRATLWSTSWELEELRSNFGEEMRKKDEEIRNLIQLLNAANMERDEAKNQLEMLLKYLSQAETPQLSSQPRCSSSSFADSEGLSDTQNQHSYAHSPAANSIGGSNGGGDSSSNLYMDQLMKKPLPEKGKLLEAVMAAGPLLCTLMVIGDLPQWRNPPALKLPALT